MTLEKLRCSLVPDDATLKKFDVIGELDCRLVWNRKTKRNDIIILSDIRFILKKYNCEILIRAGFICDGGSVPRLFWTSVGSPYATRLLLAFILHDGIYSAEHFKRNTCDWICLEIMQELGANWYTRNKVWIAVRAGGASVWNDHTDETRLKAQKLVTLEQIRLIK